MTAVAPTSTDVAPDTTPELKLEVFREVPDHDPRSLVLKYGDKLLDLQFCGCPNKYKKRFSAFLNENRTLYESIAATALTLQKQGYQNVDVKEILDYLRLKAKSDTSASNFLQQYPHDFTLDSLPRAYLIRKLMMELPALFGFFEISPIKCRSNCGFPTEEEVVEEEPTSLAGF